MAYSMTGYGSGEVRRKEMTITVELKSVNNRFLEISFRAPPLLVSFENQIREIIRKELQRGKLYVSIALQDTSDATLDIRVDPEKARAILSLLEDLKRQTGVRDKIRLDHLLNFSELFESNSPTEGPEGLWEDVQSALKTALSDLKQMRQQEGRTLIADLAQRIRNLQDAVSQIEEINQGVLPEAYRKMTDRVNRLLEGTEVKLERIDTEIAILADKIDVTEECVRLKSHCQMFLELLDKNESIGKKLNFLLQEMNREANTISSKSIETDVSHLVVVMKEEIEKVREQVQNLE